MLVMFVCGVTTFTTQAQIVHNDNVEIEKSDGAKLDMTHTGNNKTWRMISGLYGGFQIGYLTGGLTGNTAPFIIKENGYIGMLMTSPNNILDPLTVNGNIGIFDANAGIKLGGKAFISAPGSNTFLGVDAGINIGTGTKNVFVGNSAGKNNDTGSENLFLGNSAGEVNVGGNYNTFIGRLAGGNNLNGHRNLFLGRQSGFLNDNGSDNIYMGYSAGRSNKGSQNVFLGSEAGFASTLSANNVFIGFNSGRNVNNTTGRNTYIGTQSGSGSTTGSNNVAIGYESGKALMGEKNVAVGVGAGSGGSASGNSNVYLGYEAGVGAESYSDRLYIANKKNSDRTPLIYGEFDNGKVGINTTSPTNSLHVYSSDHGGLSLETAHQKNAYISFHEQNSGNVAELKSGLRWDAINNNFSLETFAGGDIVLNTVNGGSVGINTTTLEPSSVLTVGGRITATEFYLEGGAPFMPSPWGTTGTSAITFNSGTVGIGSVIDEDANLHVQGAGSADGDVISSIMIGKLNGPQIQAIQESTDNDVQGLAFRVKSSGAWADDSFEAMRISKDGRLGIGTTSPESAVHIQDGVSGGTAHSSSKLTVESSGKSLISILTPNDKSGYYGFADTDNNLVGGMQYNHATDLMTLNVNNLTTPSISMDNAGFVGIGTTVPQEKLEVVGNTLIQGDLEVMKVVVTATPGQGWPDYVFEPEFKLRPLSEVEAFVNENRHLPEVPSAKEVEANGIDLGNMDATLLKKVEELTLYMIEMNKKIEKLEEENKQLKELVKKDK